MDLRDRASFEVIRKNLDLVPSGKFQDLCKTLSSLTSEEHKVDRESGLLTTKLYEKEAIGKRVGKSFGNLRLHAFFEAPSKNVTFRLCGDEVGEKYFSDFVSRVDITLHPSMEKVCWTRSTETSVDGISISRPNNGTLQAVEAVVHVNYRNCLYEAPAVLVGGKQNQFMTFVDLFKSICGYIKAKNLSSNDDPSYFTPDTALHDMLYPNHPKDLPASFASLLEAIRNRFKTPGPFSINHKVGMNERIFDLVVHLPDVADCGLSTKVNEAERKLKDKLCQLDAEIASATSNVDQTARDAKFLDKLAANPADYLRQILETPTGVAAPIESEGQIDYLNMTTSHEFYRQPWAVSAAAYVVNEQKKEASF